VIVPRWLAACYRIPPSTRTRQASRHTGCHHKAECPRQKPAFIARSTAVPDGARCDSYAPSFANSDDLGRKSASISAYAPSGLVAAYKTPAPSTSNRLPSSAFVARSGEIVENRSGRDEYSTRQSRVGGPSKTGDTTLASDHVVASGRHDGFRLTLRERLSGRVVVQVGIHTHKPRACCRRRLDGFNHLQYLVRITKE
jgi:hypothetical protein